MAAAPEADEVAVKNAGGGGGPLGVMLALIFEVAALPAEVAMAAEVLFLTAGAADAGRLALAAPPVGAFFFDSALSSAGVPSTHKRAHHRNQSS